MIIDCISDLHGFYPDLEGGDLLIVAGDLTSRDTKEQHIDFSMWLAAQNYSHKVVIAGNHDNRLILLGGPVKAPRLDYLLDSGTEFQGLKIWGSPWTKWFPQVNPKCSAFMLKTEDELAEKWKLIPDDIDVLVTHGPPHGILDKNINKYSCGSESLTDYVLRSNRRQLHVFGHIHESYGIEQNLWGGFSINASHVNERYEPVNKPIRVIL